MNNKYLIVQCNELGDQWECDADRRPLCVTDDYSDYGLGFEVYVIETDGSLILIKNYDESNETGMAVYIYNDDLEGPSQIFEKYPKKTRREIKKSQITIWKSMYGFTETVNNIYTEIRQSGQYAEEINGKWIVIGEYADDYYSSGA